MPPADPPVRMTSEAALISSQRGSTLNLRHPLRFLTAFMSRSRLRDSAADLGGDTMLGLHVSQDGGEDAKPTVVQAVGTHGTRAAGERGACPPGCGVWIVRGFGSAA